MGCDFLVLTGSRLAGRPRADARPAPRLDRQPGVRAAWVVAGLGVALVAAVPVHVGVGVLAREPEQGHQLLEHVRHFDPPGLGGFQGQRRRARPADAATQEYAVRAPGYTVRG